MAAWRATMWICQRSIGLIVAFLQLVWAMFCRLSARSQVVVAGGIAALLLLAAVAGGQERAARTAGDSAASSPESPTTTAERIPLQETTTSTEQILPITTSTPPSPTATATSTTLANSVGAAGASTLTVRSITDGDTLTVSDGRRVRLAQVDAPETNECYGSESTAALTRLAAGKLVVLRRPTNGPETDRYGRTLAEVYAGSSSVNEALVREGSAEWGDGFANEDADTASRLRSAETEARMAGRGLWSACGSALTAAPSTQAPALGGGGACDPAYPDDCIPSPPPDLDCGEIKRLVRVDHRHGDPHGFDADRNGWGCESFG